jgi:hypothetical protein
LGPGFTFAARAVGLVIDKQVTALRFLPGYDLPQPADLLRVSVNELQVIEREVANTFVDAGQSVTLFACQLVAVFGRVKTFPAGRDAAGGRGKDI